MLARCCLIARQGLNTRCRRSRARSIARRRSTTPGYSSGSKDAASSEGVMRRAVLAALVALLASGGNALADNFPSNPITIVVPFSAGGPSDAMSRILAERMKVTLGEAILIENVTGAGVWIGFGRAVRSPPDAYTVSLGPLATHVANAAIYNLGYALVADLEPIA